MFIDFTTEQIEDLVDNAATPQEALHIEHLFMRLDEFLNARILQATRTADGHVLLSYYTPTEGIHSMGIILPGEPRVDDENRPPLRELQNLP